MPADIAAAAAALLEARATRQWLTDLPEAARPADIEEARAIQRAVAAHFGPILAWKVGAPSLTATPNGSPLYASSLYEGVETLPAALFNRIGVEAELGYRMGADLPPRATPYSREEVLAAVASMHPMIEIADTRFLDFNTVAPMSHMADQSSHGALIIGPAQTDWRGVDAVRQRVRVVMDGALFADKEGGNSAVDPVRLLVWLANEGAAPYGGLKAGQIVTTGSAIGLVPRAPGVAVEVAFPGIGDMKLVVAK